MLGSDVIRRPWLVFCSLRYVVTGPSAQSQPEVIGSSTRAAIRSVGFSTEKRPSFFPLLLGGSFLPPPAAPFLLRGDDFSRLRILSCRCFLCVGPTLYHGVKEKIL